MNVHFQVLDFGCAVLAYGLWGVKLCLCIQAALHVFRKLFLLQHDGCRGSGVLWCLGRLGCVGARAGRHNYCSLRAGFRIYTSLHRALNL